jgi:hypothetical protein
VLIFTNSYGYLRPGKRPTDLIIDFLTCLWEYAKGQIRDIGTVIDLSKHRDPHLSHTLLAFVAP